MNKYILALSFFVVTIPFHVAYAFDTKMHVWVGKETLNDVLPDGEVSIPPFGSFQVTSEVYSAIANNQSTYL